MSPSQIIQIGESSRPTGAVTAIVRCRRAGACVAEPGTLVHFGPILSSSSSVLHSHTPAVLAHYLSSHFRRVMDMYVGYCRSQHHHMTVFYMSGALEAVSDDDAASEN